MDQIDKESPLGYLHQHIDKLSESTINLIKTLEDLKRKQTELNLSFKTNSQEYKDNANAIKQAETSLKNINDELKQHVEIVKIAKGSLQQNKQVLETLLGKYDDLSRSQGDNSRQVKDLNIQIGTLINTIARQEEKLKDSRKVFDLHKETTNAFANSFNKLKEQQAVLAPVYRKQQKGLKQ